MSGLGHDVSMHAALLCCFKYHNVSASYRLALATARQIQSHVLFRLIIKRGFCSLLIKEFARDRCSLLIDTKSIKMAWSPWHACPFLQDDAKQPFLFAKPSASAGQESSAYREKGEVRKF